MKVLIVDDMPINLMVIRELFKMTTADDVDTCANGKLALSLASQNDYDLILLDYRMPEMNGKEVLDRLKKNFSEKGIEVPVIALTGEDDPDAKERFLGMGFSGFVQKPVEPSKLFYAVQEFLPDIHIKEGEEGLRVSGRLDDTPFPEWLTKVSGLDLTEGRKHSGTTKNYLEGLSVFGSSIKRRADELSASCDSGDFEDYAIKVHALKGISGMIGATTVHELSAKLEEASDKGDTEYIIKNNPALLEEYRGFIEKLSPLFKKKKEDDSAAEKPDITEQQIIDAYLTIRECLDFYDYNSISLILDSFEEYRLPEKEKDYAGKMRDALAIINRDLLISICDMHLVGE